MWSFDPTDVQLQTFIFNIDMYFHQRTTFKFSLFRCYPSFIMSSNIPGCTFFQYVWNVRVFQAIFVWYCITDGQSFWFRIVSSILTLFLPTWNMYRIFALRKLQSYVLETLSCSLTIIKTSPPWLLNSATYNFSFFFRCLYH